MRPPTRIWKNSSRLPLEMARNFCPVEQGTRGVLGELEDPGVEIEPAQVPVDVAVTVAERGSVVPRLSRFGRRVLGHCRPVGDRHQPSSSIAPGIEEHQVFRDVGDPVRDALKVVRDEDEIGRAEDSGVVLGHHLNEVVEQSVVDAIDTVVAGGDATRLQHIARHHRGEDAAHLIAAVRRHLGHVHIRFQRRQVCKVARQLRDAHAVVTHPLQFGGHVEQADDLA